MSYLMAFSASPIQKAKVHQIFEIFIGLMLQQRVIDVSLKAKNIYKSVFS